MSDFGTSKGYFGRRRIYSTSNVITSENVIDEVNKALNTHICNMVEEQYLYWYRRGIQPILDRTKEIRPEILNKVCINNADMIATFKNGYFMTKAATYVSRKEDKAITDKISQLNEYVYLSGKYNVDNQVIDWFHTVGLGVLYVQPNNDPEIPFKTYALDPRNAFVVYSLEPGNEPVMGINMVIRDKTIWIDAITKDRFYRIQGGELTENDIRFGINNIDTTRNVLIDDQEPNVIGEIPLVEYTYNKLRMGCFENCLSIMDEINNIESNRADGIEQFIQSLMVLYNCELDDGQTANSIREMGFISLKNSGENKASLDIISQQLDQSQTQTTLNNLYEQMLDKAGVPSSVRDSGSTSDNVGSVYLRNGWATADTCARNTEDEFKVSNGYYDRIILAILKRRGFVLNPSDFELKIVRNDLNNLLVKTQAAMNMKELGFAPALAFERSGLSNDPLTDVEVSREYIDKVWNTEKEEVQPTAINANPADSGTESGDGNATEG